MYIVTADRLSIPISILTIILLVIGICIFLYLSVPQNPPNILITEVLSSNVGAVPDEDGGYPDYIELFNAGETEVNLLGWFLSDNSNRPMRWVIPNIVIAPGEYVLFYASAKDKQQNDGTWHTNFSVASNKTEPVILTMPNGTLHHYIEPFDRIPNISYGLSDDFETYVYMSLLTPGKTNAPPYHKEPPVPVSQYRVIEITEYMTRNDTYIPDEHGRYHDWVEIHNSGSETIPLRGWFLSDNPDSPYKWKFADDDIIGPGEYKILYLSGLSSPGHVSFRLSANDKIITLTDYNGLIVDEIEVFETPLYASYGRTAEDEGFFDVPTPGEPNIGIPYTSIDDIIWDKPQLLITEYMSRNRIVSSPDGNYCDWVEIFNFGDVPVSLSDLFLSDSASNLGKHGFPDGTQLSARERIVVWFDAVQGHAGFSLSSDDDGLFLSDRYGRIIDSVEIVMLPPTVSRGRDNENPANWLYFAEPTPGLQNNSSGYITLEQLHSTQPDNVKYAMPPRTDVNNINVDAGTFISLHTDEKEGIIYYTLDGKEPDVNSLKYTEAIKIDKNTVIRARVYAQDKQPSSVLTRTYIVGASHEVPIVAITSDPAGLFSHETGIYANGPGFYTETGSVFPHYGANFWQDWERKAHFAYYENGRLGLDTDAGIEIQGNWAQALPQKPLLIKFKNIYGLSKVTYPFIPDIDRIVHDAIVLRQSGQDWNFSRIKDAFITNSVIDVTNVVTMGARPVALYINGEYWGHYNLRERINEDYFKINYGIQNDEIDLIRRSGIVIAGSAAGLRELERRLNYMNTNTDEGYAYIDANIDIDNWIDYWVIVTYFGNTDTSNIKCYRQQGDGYKWRWILFDQDHAMKPEPFDSIRNMINPEGHGQQHGYNVSTSISRALLRNDAIKERFLARYAELMQTVLNPGRLIPILDNYAAQIEPEMPAQIARWNAPSSMDVWYRNLDVMRAFITGREQVIKNYIKTALNVSDADMNRIFGP